MRYRLPHADRGHAREVPELDTASLVGLERLLPLAREELVPERLFSWRWHPHAVERGVDYSAEPRTLVTFTLEDAPGDDTVLRVVESGFDALPDHRRATALLGNGNGWRGQLQKRLPSYLASA